MSPGESLRILRELQGLTQAQLSEVCGIPQTTISSIENGRVNPGVDDPAVLVFPGWQVAAERLSSGAATRYSPMRAPAPEPSALNG